MSRPKSVYLTDRSMSALRGDEALSGRLNQIVDRYLQIIESERESVLGQISRGGSNGLAQMVAVWPDLAPGDRWVDGLRVALKSTAGWADSAAISNAVQMTDAELVVLAELVEAERVAPVPGDS